MLKNISLRLFEMINERQRIGRDIKKGR